MIQLYEQKSQIPRTLSGGIIGKVAAFIDDDGITKVIKSYDDFEMLKSEALSLEQISSYGLNVPKILKLTQNPNQMILEYIDCEEHPDPRILRAGIESLHSIKSETFGNYRDGYTLRLKVTNTQSNNWIEWWTNNRWNILADALEEKDKKLMQMVSNLIPAILKDRDVVPSLIHGDYNDHNILIQKHTKKIYFIDSQCYFGDPYYEHIQYIARNASITNMSNSVDLLYLSFIYGLLHKTLSFKNSYIWRARTCMNKLLDQMSPLWPSIYCKDNKYMYQYVVLICGTEIFKDSANTRESTNSSTNALTNAITIVTNHCIKIHGCKQENVLHVLFKTPDYGMMKRQKNRKLIFERIDDQNLNKYVTPNICVDNSNFWTGSEVVNRYKTMFPNVQQVYILCTTINSGNYKYCFAEWQKFLVLGNGKYCPNIRNRKIEII